MSGKLTTHVLDTANGCPGKGVVIALWKIDSNSEVDSKTLLKTTKTNHDGRTDEPLLAGEELQTGVYELVFTVGNYFARYSDYPDTQLGARPTWSRTPGRSHPLFLDQIPIQFGISNTQADYQVPLLVSPWSYSTYRGS